MNDPSLQSGNGGLSAVADIETAQNYAHVPFHRGLADSERLADLLVTQALHNQLQHFELTATEVRARRSLRQAP